LAIDFAAAKIYSAGDELGAGTSGIWRANLDGSGQPERLTPDLPGPNGVALDLRSFTVGAPASVPSATPFDVTITALDPLGNIDVNYQGTVTFSSLDTDAGVVL